jgi:ABC-type Fe3+/spermidine/putrescine transport system ATPase subunit
MTIELQKVSKRYGDRWILRDISLHVGPGEVVGLFGCAASGKSTLLRIAAGIERPGVGTVAALRPPLLCTETPRASLVDWLMPGRARSASSGEAAFANLEDALARTEGTLLLDNVLSPMDDRMREEAVGRIRRAAGEKGLSVLLATSRFNDVLLACDRVAVLNSTYIRQEGSPRDIYEEPKTVDVAALVGRNNLIEARRLTSTKRDAPEFQSILGSHRLTARRTEKAALGAINQNVRLAIRPEQVILSFGASFPEDNLLRATITAIRFDGQSTSVCLDANGLALESLVPRLVGLQTGDECMVSLPPDRLIVLKD